MQLELLWVVPAAVAATFDTLADVISDEVVAGEDDSSEEEDEEQAKKLLGGAEPPQRPCCCPHLETKQKLTGEQDFMVSMMPMVCASVAIAATRPPDSVLHTPLMLAETDLGHVAFLAGLAYAIGYLALLKAWELVPSTVIVPCLQLSSPMVEIIEALLAPHHATHPVLAPLRGASLSVRSVSAFVIVFIGGMMASVGDDGSLAELCSPELWRERSMLWMMGGNLAFSVYYVIMGLVTSPDAPDGYRLTNAEFMACTNLVAVASFSCYVAASRPLRKQCASAYGIRCGTSMAGARRVGQRVHWAARAMSVTAECCNYVAMFAISFAFNLYPNAGLVAAARSSINQMTNCVCAWLLYRCYRFGRPVEGMKLKLLSTAVVGVGLLVGSGGAAEGEAAR